MVRAAGHGVEEEDPDCSDSKLAPAPVAPLAVAVPSDREEPWSEECCCSCCSIVSFSMVLGPCAGPVGGRCSVRSWSDSIAVRSEGTRPCWVVDLSLTAWPEELRDSSRTVFSEVAEADRALRFVFRSRQWMLNLTSLLVVCLLFLLLLRCL